jgi:hypothetical protein
MTADDGICECDQRHRHAAATRDTATVRQVTPHGHTVYDAHCAQREVQQRHLRALGDEGGSAVGASLVIPNGAVGCAAVAAEARRLCAAGGHRVHRRGRLHRLLLPHSQWHVASHRRRRVGQGRGEPPRHAALCRAVLWRPQCSATCCVYVLPWCGVQLGSCRASCLPPRSSASARWRSDRLCRRRPSSSRTRRSAGPSRTHSRSWRTLPATFPTAFERSASPLGQCGCDARSFA